MAKPVFACFVRAAFIAATFTATVSVRAQDPRVALYESIPMLINPALTGASHQPLRVSAMGAQVSTDRLSNSIGNLGLDAALGKKQQLGVGLNLMASGNKEFIMSGKYVGLSVARRFFLDKEEFHQLRVGGQVSFLSGSLDETKGGYDKYLDVRAFRYWRPSNTRLIWSSGSYLNYSIGAYYRFQSPRLSFESGVSAYNITNPLGHNIVEGSPVRKRYRATSLVSFTFNYNPANSFRFESFAWYEGLYLREYKPLRDDTTHIHENTYSLSWYRVKAKRPYSLGLYSRSLKSFYGVARMQLSPAWSFALSYERPLYKKYYGVSHMEMGLTVFPLRSKKSKEVAPAYDPLLLLMQQCPCLNGNTNTDTAKASAGKPVQSHTELEPAPVVKDTLVASPKMVVDTIMLGQPEQDTATLAVAPKQAIGPAPAVLAAPLKKLVLVDSMQPKVIIPKDTDRDGIPDEMDQCPTAKGPASNRGCPEDVEILQGAKATYIIYFDYDKSLLKPASVTELNLVMEELRKHSGSRVVLTGHTDLNGGDEYNMKLSKRRVDAAASFLKEKGFGSEIEATSFKGKRQPKFNDNSKVHAAINRRVEISVIY